MPDLNPSRFQALADQGYNRIPVFRQISADLDTPLSVYLKLADGPSAFLLESVQGGENWGRYSIIGLPCRRAWRAQGRTLEKLDFGQVVERHEDVDPLDELARVMAEIRSPRLDDLPGFAGGLVGYFAYEIVSHLEPRLSSSADFSDKPDALDVPDILLLDAEELAVFDNLSGRLSLIVLADPSEADAYARAERRLDQLSHRLRCGSPGYPPAQQLPVPEEADYRFEFERKDFLQAVQHIKDYIFAGDAMQVVLSQRMSVDLAARPLDVYRALRSLNPSPYMYFFDFGDFQVVGASPEVLVRVQDGEAMVRPIAGTRPRGATPEEDRALEVELKADPKELAEHLMLIDLGRNDIGRIAETGSVVLTDQMVIERYSHVMHLVSEVHGKIDGDRNALDVLRATFPAGTLSGAPKVRAMEIIAELEPVRRGVYAGAVGYLNWFGEADLAIAIRTALVKQGTVHVQAGAGIVADSDPDREWEETLNKGRALIRAIAEASGGLHQ
ncbi:MAG: anthranilate synthase component I [Pseudomonadota bacterium]